MQIILELPDEDGMEWVDAFCVLHGATVLPDTPPDEARDLKLSYVGQSMIDTLRGCYARVGADKAQTEHLARANAAPVRMVFNLAGAAQAPPEPTQEAPPEAPPEPPPEAPAERAPAEGDKEAPGAEAHS